MIASAWAVTYTGATPVFVDCSDDLTVDIDLLEAAITPRTKVIMPVHIYGRRCRMDEILGLAYQYNLRVVEDSAEAHGVAPTGDIACFSLFANKIITAGEGGICLTDDPRLAAQMAHLRAMAFTAEHNFIHKKVAYNYRMTAMQAAVALAQTERLDEILAARAEIEKRYDAGLRDLPGITLMPSRDVLWMYDVRATRRAELRAHLDAAGIETRLFFQPMSRQPMYFDPRWPALNATRFAADGFYLPTHTSLSGDDIDVIVAEVRAFAEGRA
jgi:dTDP-4-amino-4,6-dideoxygalactose transaminase